MRVVFSSFSPSWQLVSLPQPLAPPLPASTVHSPQEHKADLPGRMALKARLPPAVFIVWPFRET